MYSAGRLPLLSEAAQAEMYDVLNVMLFDAGYMRYEISNFAKPGYECRHNLKYWHLQPYLGLGPAAVSFDGRVRTKNSSDLDRYLELAARGQPPPCEIETLDQAKLREEYIMMALRLGEGLSVGALEERFGFDIMKEKTREIESLVKSGHITLENGCIRLAKKALFISDEVIVRLI
jgi:oxygen-independent coproporphyrinogen-3 oxidase